MSIPPDSLNSRLRAFLLSSAIHLNRRRQFDLRKKHKFILRGLWQESTAYNRFDVVIKDGIYYLCLAKPGFERAFVRMGKAREDRGLNPDLSLNHEEVDLLIQTERHITL